MASTSTYALTKVHIFSGSAFINVPNVISVGGPNIEAETIEITSMDSVNFREYVASPLKNPGALEFSINYVPSDATHRFLVRQASTTGSLNQFKTIFADGTTFEFSGSFTAFSIKSDNPASNVLVADAKVQISGQISGSF